MTEPKRQPKVMEAFYKDFEKTSFTGAVANVLQYLIDEHREVRGNGRVDKKSQVVTLKTLMKLIEELE